ncbi:MAG: rhomboid family intramembrane serine protease [Alphaproteobacteria bacterium]|nr:rhomboid family intramembrane serine protease [Alphaproteobacteria bacterium]
MIPIRDDNPTTLRPLVTIGLIGVCVLVFLWQIGQPAEQQERIFYALGLIPAVLFGHAELPPELVTVSSSMTVLTSMFLHGGFLHLAGNMLYLWIFGNNVEDAMGHGRFVAFYVLCGIAAALTQGMLNPESTVPMVGASGAIGGVLGAYLLLHPRAIIWIVVPIFFYLHVMRVPAFVMLGLWFLMQFLSTAMMEGSGGGVAYGAHVGGFVAGMILIPFFRYPEVPLLNRGPAGPRRGPWG